MSAPDTRPDCPAWCTDHDDRTAEAAQESSNPFYVRLFDQHHALRDCGSGTRRVHVSLRQGAGVDSSEITLYVGHGAFPLALAREVAALMHDMDRDDVAAVIRDLAATVTGQDGTR